MDKHIDKFEFKMSRYEILKYSGCLRRILTRLIIIIILALGIVLSKNINNDTLQSLGIAVSLAFLLVFVIIIISDFILLFKILTKRYKIMSKTVKSLATKRPFDTFSTYNKVLVFNNFRLVVDNKFADGISIGDLITLVFANGEKYPIIIIKRNLVKG